MDIITRPVSLDEPIGRDRLHRTEPIVGTTGGLVSNAGIALAKIGAKAAAFSRVGADAWGDVIRRNYQQNGVDTTALETDDAMPSSVTVVLVDADGQRSFAHSQGAPKAMDAAYYQDRLDLFASTRSMLLGYYSLLGDLQEALPSLLAEIRKRGCWTALDAAGDGGEMSPLDKILPHLDFYIPSRHEAQHQTGESDPARMLKRFRECGADGIIGVKLGEEGALLSEVGDGLIEIPAAAPPGPIVDTTGAGDSFYAGVLYGRLQGWPLGKCGRLGAIMGAHCITRAGASAGITSAVFDGLED